MATSVTASNKSTQPAALMLASLLVPGLGQFLLGKRSRALLIFLTGVITLYVVNWSLVQQKVAVLTLGTLSTSWLWLPLIAFWAWNVLDVRSLVRGEAANLLIPIALIGVILYVIAWNVTEVRLNRLVERAGDAQRLATNLLNPDVISVSVNGEDQICAWQCLWQYAGDKLAGRPPIGTLHASKNFLDIIGRVKPQLAPSWMVRLGLAEQGTRPNQFVAGS